MVDVEEADLRISVAVEAVAQIVAEGRLVAAEVLLQPTAYEAQALARQTQSLLETRPNGIHRSWMV